VRGMRTKLMNRLVDLMILALVVGLLVVVTQPDALLSVFRDQPPQPYRQGPSDEPVISLEINVDWGEEFIPAMLETLKARDIKATFFVSGRWADKNPDLLKTIAEAGHEIGSHGYLHKAYSQLTYEDNREQIQRAQTAIEQACGLKPTLFAPPSGDYGDATLRAADALGMKTVLWSIDTIDWRKEGVDPILSRVMKKAHNGGFILMHPTQYTAQALPTMLDQLAQQGYRFAPVGDQIRAGA
jgi:probable sporulation protein (polysaccharide deacetylase family)